MKGFIWLMAGIGVLAIITLGMETPQERECKSRGSAYGHVKETIESRLKAPSTADWPGRNDSAVSVVKSDEGECSYEVRGYVDAQNGFGAMVRSRYSAEVWYSKEDSRWMTTKIDM